MTDERSRGIGDVVQAFLRQYVESYEALETLLLLSRERERLWTPEAVAERLGTSNTIAHEALEHWLRSGLVSVEPAGGPRFKYHAATPELDHATLRLAEDYERRRLEVMRLMSKNAIERVRTAAIRTFADAFVLGRKKDG